MPASTQTVRVDLGPRGYDIEIGSGNLPQLGRFLTARAEVSRAVVITDENVQEPYDSARPKACWPKRSTFSSSR